jgi:hypothetical protein
LVQFIIKARLLSDLALTSRDDITSGRTFEAFWRTLVYNRDNRGDLRDERPSKSMVGCAFAYWYMLNKLYLTRKWENEDPANFSLHCHVLQKLAAPFSLLLDMCYGNSRSFLLTESGRIGWAPHTASPGDAIGMFHGNKIPFAAKAVPGGGDKIWEYAGGCYVHGCMDGEIWRSDGL